jgi:hypothetical protein
VALAANYNRAQSELGFGMGADNPYAASTLNRDQLSTNQRGIVNGSGRQLYAGSTLNKQSAARSQYDRNQKQIEDKIAEAQSGYASGTAQTARDEALGVQGIKEGAIERRAASKPAPLRVRGGRAPRGRVASINGKQNIRRPARLNGRGRGRV